MISIATMRAFDGCGLSQVTPNSWPYGMKSRFIFSLIPSKATCIPIGSLHDFLFISLISFLQPILQRESFRLPERWDRNRYTLIRIWYDWKSVLSYIVISFFIFLIYLTITRLGTVSGTCWSPKYELKMWSNVFCVLRGDVWHKAVQKFVVRSDAIPKLD